MGNALKEIDPSFLLNIQDRPSVLCVGCYIKVNKGTVSSYVDYSKIKVKENRNQIKCICIICEIASSRASSHLFKKISPAVTPLMIPKKVPVRPSLVIDYFKSKVMKICTSCNGEIHRGVKHSCTKRTKIVNAVNFTIKGVEQQVAAEIINSESKKAGSATISINKGRGRNMQVTIKRKTDDSTPVPAIPTSVLKNIQLDCNMSTNSVKKMCKSLRTVNKKIVEPSPNSKLQADTRFR